MRKILFWGGARSLLNLAGYRTGRSAPAFELGSVFYRGSHHAPCVASVVDDFDFISGWLDVSVAVTLLA